ncbi:MAG: fimbria/pilus outer membrane usher protein, partial [Bryobacteraceae bacterium]
MIWPALLFGLLPGVAMAQASYDGMLFSLLGIRVNGAMVSEFEPVYNDPSSGYAVTAALLDKAHIRLPSTLPVHAGNRDYYPLAGLRGVVVRLNQSEQMLEIEVPPEDMTDTILQVSHLRVGRPEASEPGLFLNHDFQYSRSSQASGLSGLMEAGMFSSLGVLTTRVASSNLLNQGGMRRLDTQFFRDFPERRATLSIGDAISGGNPWARQVYFAGVRWASKFTTQRGFVPYALPSLSGTAVSPSVVDVFVNNVKLYSKPVDMGPFTINNVPILSSQGQIQMVVTDALGRQQVISQQYIATVQVLQRGVSEYTYELGTLRRNYGFSSFGYGSFFAEATHRYGLTDHLTIEGRGEAALTSRTIGGGLSYAWTPVGILSGGVAGSNDSARSGYLLYGSFSHPARFLSYAAQLQVASRDFRQLGLLEYQRAPVRVAQASVNRALGSRVSATLGYLQRDGRTEISARSVFASLTLRMGRGVLSLGGNYATLSEAMLTGQRYGATMSLIIPLGGRTIASSTADVQPSGTTVYSELQKSPPLGPGYGYRLRTASFNSNRIDAGLSYQNNSGAYLIETSQTAQGSGYRIGRTGSIVLMHGHVLPSRWLLNSFAVVEVPGQKNADVIVNNQVQAHTNSRGVAMVPVMVAYDNNTVRIDDKSVPLDS